MSSSEDGDFACPSRQGTGFKTVDPSAESGTHDEEEKFKPVTESIFQEEIIDKDPLQAVTDTKTSVNQVGTEAMKVAEGQFNSKDGARGRFLSICPLDPKENKGELCKRVANIKDSKDDHSSVDKTVTEVDMKRMVQTVESKLDGKENTGNQASDVIGNNQNRSDELVKSYFGNETAIEIVEEPEGESPFFPNGANFRDPESRCKGNIVFEYNQTPIKRNTGITPVSIPGIKARGQMAFRWEQKLVQESMRKSIKISLDKSGNLRQKKLAYESNWAASENTKVQSKQAGGGDREKISSTIRCAPIASHSWRKCHGGKWESSVQLDHARSVQLDRARSRVSTLTSKYNLLAGRASDVDDIHKTVDTTPGEETLENKTEHLQTGGRNYGNETCKVGPGTDVTFQPSGVKHQIECWGKQEPEYSIADSDEVKRGSTDEMSSNEPTCKTSRLEDIMAAGFDQITPASSKVEAMEMSSPGLKSALDDDQISSQESPEGDQDIHLEPLNTSQNSDSKPNEDNTPDNDGSNSTVEMTAQPSDITEPNDDVIISQAVYSDSFTVETATALAGECTLETATSITGERTLETVTALPGWENTRNSMENPSNKTEETVLIREAADETVHMLMEVAKAVAGEDTLGNTTALIEEGTLETATVLAGEGTLETATGLTEEGTLETATVLTGEGTLETTTVLDEEGTLETATALAGEGTLETATELPGWEKARNSMETPSNITEETLLIREAAKETVHMILEDAKALAEDDNLGNTAVLVEKGTLDTATSLAGEGTLDTATALAGEGTFDTATALAGESTLEAATAMAGGDTLETATVPIEEGTLETVTAMTAEGTLETASTMTGENTMETASTLKGGCTLETATVLAEEGTLDTATVLAGDGTLDTATVLAEKSTVDTASTMPGKNTMETATALPGWDKIRNWMENPSKHIEEIPAPAVTTDDEPFSIPEPFEEDKPEFSDEDPEAEAEGFQICPDVTERFQFCQEMGHEEFIFIQTLSDAVVQKLREHPNICATPPKPSRARRPLRTIATMQEERRQNMVLQPTSAVNIQFLLVGLALVILLIVVFAYFWQGMLRINAGCPRQPVSSVKELDLGPMMSSPWEMILEWIKKRWP